MHITTTDRVEGQKIKEDLGIVKGNTVRAKNAFRDWTQGVRNFFGGELKSYSSLFTDAREEALERMEQQAQEKGADAVVNVRFQTSKIAKGGSEILAYGTAVKLED